MDDCPRCGDAVDDLHPIPAEIITKELVDEIGDDDPVDLDVCTDCISDLMAEG